jgi:hypothetical protein
MKESPENTCKTFAEHISAYVDGQLSGELLETVEKHLQQCPHCARQLEHYNLFKKLINSERQNCPVDLTSVVMAGLERDHLLQGLESLSKPPTPRWIKVVRALSAAAMLALIASAGLIIMQFTGNNQKSSVSINQAPTAVKRGLKVEKPAPQPQQELAYEAPSRETPFDVPAPAPMAKTNKEISELPVPAREIPAEKKILPSLSDSRTLADTESSADETGSVSMDSMAQTMPARTNAPLALRPSPVSSAPALTLVPSFPKKGDRAWPVELVYQLNSSDLPGWMLLKEQVIIALMENDIPSLHDSYDVAQALENDEEFFYQAKKGIDLPPGSRSVQILLVTRPQTFARIHASLQQAMSDTSRQELSPELETYIRSQTTTPELANRTQSTFAALDRLWGITKSRPALLATTQATQPTTTTAAVATTSAPTSQPTSRAASQPQQLVSTSLPAKVTTTSASTRPAISQLPILIKIEIAKPTPTTTTTTAPTTQTTMPSPK